MPTSLVPLFPGLPGGPEMIVILLIVVLLFGANKLPKLARSSGQAMGEFKKGREEIEEELSEMRGGNNEPDPDDSFDSNDEEFESEDSFGSQGGFEQANTGQRGGSNQPNSGGNQPNRGGNQPGRGGSQQDRGGGQQNSGGGWGNTDTNRERSRR